MQPQSFERQAHLPASQEPLAHWMHTVRHEVLGQEQLKITEKLVVELHIAALPRRLLPRTEPNRTELN